MKENIVICAIESSCDDTSAAVLKGRHVISNIIADQEVHREFGGVVPELASRAHQQNILPVVNQALAKVNIKPEDLDAIAFTSGPGLMGSLLVGASFARGLATSLKIPAYGIHHMRAHILAHFIDDAHTEPPPFPFLCLTVSGGHTQLVKVSGSREFEILGQTIDDAAGEAFDKAAKMLGLPYPGGPMIDKFANEGNPLAFEFAKPKIADLNFSFSGLKTSILYFLKAEKEKNPHFIEENLNDLCASIQKTIVDILIDRLRRASKKTDIEHIALAGGVSANSALRKAVLENASNLGWTAYIPPMKYCTDNAAMIGICAQLDLENNLSPSKEAVQARSSLF